MTLLALALGVVAIVLSSAVFGFMYWLMSLANGHLYLQIAFTVLAAWVVGRAIIALMI